MKRVVSLCTSILCSGLMFDTVSAQNTNELDHELTRQLLSMSLQDLLDLEVITVATGLQQTENKAPSTVTVITAQDIKRMGARTLEEALQRVPGFQVSYNWFNSAVYSVRGVSTSFNPEVLVLVNGVRLNDSYSGGKHTFWTGFPVSSIARLEIIRGPGSALYGADAFAGVINIITKTAQDIDGTEVGLRVGNNNMQDVWLLHGQQWRDIEIAAMVELSRTDGHQRRVDSDAQTAFDQLFNTQASLAPGQYGSEATHYDLKFDLAWQHWRLRTSAKKNDHTGAGVGVAQALDPHKPRNMERISGDVSYDNAQFSKNWALNAQLNYWRTRFLNHWQLFPPGAFGGAYPMGYLGHPGNTETLSQASITSTYRGFHQHSLRIGAGYGYYDLSEVTEQKNFGLHPLTHEPLSPLTLFDGTDTSATYSPEVARNNYFAFIQDTWTIHSAWELTLGLRYDHYSDFGSTINPRIGLVWEARKDFIAKLLYGSAFRAPSFQDQYNQNNPVAIGNPDLQPEKMDTWELAFDYHATSALRLSLNLFHYEIEDKIVLIPLGTTGYQFENASTWKGQGGEFEARWKISPKASVLFNYSYQDSEDDTGITLSNASQQAAYLRGDYVLNPRWHTNVQVNWNNGWARSANDPRSNLKGYTTLDMTLRREEIRAGDVGFAISIRNVLDADVRYPSPGPDTNGLLNVPHDLPGAGRSYFAELRYQF